MPLTGPGAEQTSAASERDMPEKYAVTGLYLILRACERFGIDPFGAGGWPALLPGAQAVLLEYDRVRRHEEVGMRH